MNTDNHEKENIPMTLSPGQSEADYSDHIFLAFARVLLTRMEEWTASYSVPVVYHSMTIFYEEALPEELDGKYVTWRSLPIEEKADYASLLLLFPRDHVWVSKEAQEYFMYWIQIVGSPFKAEILPFFENASAPHQAYIFLVGSPFLAPILDTLEHDGTFHPTQVQLLDSFHRFRDELANPNIYCDITIPLFDVFCDVQHKEMLGSFELSPFTIEEKEEVWNTFENLPLDQRVVNPIDIDAFSDTYFQLTTTYAESIKVFRRWNVMGDVVGSHSTPRSKYISPQLIEKVEELEDIITVLRLINHGNVQTLGLIEIEKTKSSFYRKKRGSVYMLHNRRINSRTLPHRVAYWLHKNDLSTMRICFDTLRRWRMQNENGDKPHGQLSVAIRRFNQSYNREFPEDQIIDLTIALESSLLADLRDELSYRLSLRGTALLAPTGKWEPSKSQALLKAMYDIRSSIVHGGRLLTELEREIRKLQKVGIEPHDFVQQCENIVRDVLKEYVLREPTGQPLKQINEELDKHIVDILKLQSHPEEKEAKE